MFEFVLNGRVSRVGINCKYFQICSHVHCTMYMYSRRWKTSYQFFKTSSFDVKIRTLRPNVQDQSVLSQNDPDTKPKRPGYKARATRTQSHSNPDTKPERPGYKARATRGYKARATHGYKARATRIQSQSDPYTKPQRPGCKTRATRGYKARATQYNFRATQIQSQINLDTKSERVCYKNLCTITWTHFPI